MGEKVALLFLIAFTVLFQVVILDSCDNGDTEGQCSIETNHEEEKYKGKKYIKL